MGLYIFFWELVFFRFVYQFLKILLKYSGLKILHQFQVYHIVLQYFYTLPNGHHDKSSHPLPPSQVITVLLATPPILDISSVQFSRSVVSTSLRPHEPQHSRPPCPSPAPRVYSNSSIESVMPSSHLILCRPLPLLPPSPPSIGVFSTESTLHMRWPKYWSFSFSVNTVHHTPEVVYFITLVPQSPSLIPLILPPLPLAATRVFPVSETISVLSSVFIFLDF